MEELKKFNHIYVAHSGGVDSQLLLKLATKNVAEKNITILHVNHGISDNSDYWELFCKNVAEELGVGFKSLKLDLKDINSNVENIARQKRYDWFKKVVKENTDSVLLTGHHLNDQVETVLFRLFRGAGLSGLTGIHEKTKMDDMLIMRPLLNYTKVDIIKYANDYNLSWIEDESNNTNDYDRNYIRNQISPEIKKRFPNYEKGIQQTVETLNKTRLFEQEMAFDVLTKVETNKELNTLKLREYNGYLQSLVVREWFKKHNGKYPNKNMIKDILNNSVNKVAHNAGKIEKKEYNIEKRNHLLKYKMK